MQAIAILPAAGRSERMGQPKLLLPWGSTTLIEHVIAQWKASRVDRVIMVVHPGDDQLAALGEQAGAEVLRPQPPPSEMKVSVRWALEHLAKGPMAPTDAWLLAPADVPGLRTATINGLIAAYQHGLSDRTQLHQPPRIWAASHDGRTGHPVLFPWAFAEKVASLGPSEGLNALLKANPVTLVELGPGALCDDVDTPADYQRLREQDGN